MKTAVYLLISTLALIACSTPAAPEFDLRPTYLNEVSRGWGFFSDRNYGLASTNFRIAIEADEERIWPEAYIGLGWSLAMQDSLTKSINNFDTALSRQLLSTQDSLSIFAGLSLAYRDVTPPNFTLVRDNALNVLESDPNYVFEYKHSINADDLEAVLAEAYFNLTQYEDAAAIADPDSLLDPESASYQTDLLTKINLLIMLSREGE
jgi:tetratricopeptide (TPR) repeat protein